MSDNEIFKKIRPSEKKAILASLIKDQIEMLAKGESESIFYFSAQKVLTDETILVKLVPDSPPILHSDLIIVNFSYMNDRYFFQSTWATGREPGSIAIDVGSEFFILQRRKAPRLELPPEYVSRMNISSHLERAVFCEAILHDFGTGGCRLIYDKLTPIFKTGDLFRGFLRIGKKNPFELNCEVRHTLFKPEKPSVPQIFGVQFVSLSSIDKNRLMIVFMDLQRDLFTKKIESP
jgi:hypothetical protein